jgi:uncharacterized protein (TIGR02145 family)
MKKYLGFAAVSVFLLSCADYNTERDNPYDERAYNFIGKSSAEGSSSSVDTDNNPSSSSSVVYSSSSVEPSSSSVPPSSSSVAPSSSSSIPSSSSLGGGYSSSYGSVAYEGQAYRTVVIGEQTWFAENLNYNVEGSRCYGDKNGSDSKDRCSTYGRLYDWATAQTVCPPGWSLPTEDDWDELSRYVQSTSGCSSSCDAKLLKAASGWNSNGNGKNEYGFSALPGGGRLSGGSVGSVGFSGIWWSASENYSDSAYYRGMLYVYEYASWYLNSKSYLLSVRCLQD